MRNPLHALQTSSNCYERVYESHHAFPLNRCLTIAKTSTKQTSSNKALPNIWQTVLILSSPLRISRFDIFRQAAARNDCRIASVHKLDPIPSLVNSRATSSLPMVNPVFPPFAPLKPSSRHPSPTLSLSVSLHDPFS